MAHDSERPLRTVPLTAVAEPVAAAERQERIAATCAASSPSSASTSPTPTCAETDRRVAKMYVEMFSGLARGRRARR